MLVLTRKNGGKVIVTVLGITFTITVKATSVSRTRLEFDAPDEVIIVRGELVEQDDGEDDGGKG